MSRANPDPSSGSASARSRVAASKSKSKKHKKKKHLGEPELHLIGEIVGGSGFELSSHADNAFCVFEFVADNAERWECVEGATTGQTQVDYPADLSGGAFGSSGGENVFVWNHPLDVHYFFSAVQGWPYVLFEVHSLDFYGSRELLGYGFTFVPHEEGCHEIEVPIWQPLGTSHEEVMAFFLGGRRELRNKDIIVKSSSETRCRILTQTAGKVHLRLEVVLRSMAAHSLRTS